jgi:hypothetical protein
MTIMQLKVITAATLVASTAALSSSTSSSDSCPYTSFTWVGHEKENPYFWKSPDFDWAATSTLAVFGDITDSSDRIEMRDYAQSLGISVVAGTSPSSIDMGNETQRQQWIADRVAYAQEQGLNGMNIDYEGHKPSKTEGFNDVVVEFCDAMHEAIPGSSVSVDVPFYPEYEGRNYDYARIATACDALFVMAYDGEFWDNIQCVVTTANCSQANAPLELVEYGAQQYLAKGVPPEKLFLGLPWYGLKYETVAHVPFFTGQLDYSDVVAAIAQAGDKGSVSFDERSSTNVFDCGGLCSQWSDAITDRTTSIWFDDAASLAPKYAVATKYGLGGVGMWEANKVAYNPNATLPDAAAMWNSLCQRDFGRSSGSGSGGGGGGSAQ